MSETKCCEIVMGEGKWGVFHRHSCRNKAAVERGGKPYCGTHDPVRRKAISDEKDAAYRAKLARDEATREWNRAAYSLCIGVDTETMKKLGQGWLEKYLRDHVEGGRQ